jgi:hypothetical protein
MQLVPIIINVVSLNPYQGEVYSIQHYVIKFVSEMYSIQHYVIKFVSQRSVVVSSTLVYSANKTDRQDITGVKHHNPNHNFLKQISVLGLGLWCSMLLLTIFQ